MPWEETEQYIRSGHENPNEFQQDSLRTFVVSQEEGIKAVIGKRKGKDATEIFSYLFDKTKGWTLDEAKAWYEKHKKSETVHERFSAILPFQILEKLADKPLRIRGVALTAGISRNFNIYTPDELQEFADRLVAAPIYIEHVTASNAVGKVTKTEWDGRNLWYEAEVYDAKAAEKIRNGLIRHVSVGADYETLDRIDGKIPRGLHNAELSLVAVPGVPESSIQVMEKLHIGEQANAPVIAGEYVLGFHQDFSAFLPEHFSTVWLDRENGVLAVIGKLRTEPETQRVQSIFFAQEKMWNENKIRDWLQLHPHYMTPANAQNQTGNLAEKLLKTPNPAVSAEHAVRMIQKVLPQSMVERSWGLGPQRLCQELRGIVLRLREEAEKNEVGLRSRHVTRGVSQAELAETNGENEK